MSISAAQMSMGRINIGNKLPRLADNFQLSGQHGIEILNLTGKTAQNQAANTDGQDSLEMKTPWNDWKTALKERLITMIATGQIGGALDLANTHLSAFSADHATDTLKILDSALKTLGNYGFEQEAAKFMSYIPNSNLSAQIQSVDPQASSEIAQFAFATSAGAQSFEPFKEALDNMDDGILVVEASLNATIGKMASAMALQDQEKIDRSRYKLTPSSQPRM